MEEEWKPVDGFDGYFISNLGNVMSTKFTTPRLLKKSENIDWYNEKIFRIPQTTWAIFIF